jgi:ribosomal protein S7
MKNRKKFLKSEIYNKLYHLYIKTLVGKLIKKGHKFKAYKIFKNIKENIKVQINKEREISFIFFLAMLNSMPKVSFKEIRLGSQKKEIPISISERKQVLVSVETLLKFSRKNKKLELDKLIECIISSYQNKGIIIRNKKFKYRKAIVNKMLLNVFKTRKLD